MVKKTTTKTVIKDIIIVGVGVVAIWMCVLIGLGAQNPFYVVASGSMIPELQVYDVLIVQGECFDFYNVLNSNCIKFDWYAHFEDIEIGDVIVFDRPSDHNRVIVHRVASITDEEPKTLRTKGDANPSSIPGTDFPITQEEYIGKVVYTLPQVGYVTQALKPPINYILIVIVVVIMILKQVVKRKSEKEFTLTDPLESGDKDAGEPPEIGKMEKDSEYSKHIEKSESIDELEVGEEAKSKEELEDIEEKLEGIEESIEDEETSKKDNKE